MQFQGTEVPAGFDYTGDADPPTTVDVHDLVENSDGRFSVHLTARTLRATQTLRRGDEVHTKVITCRRVETTAPSIRPR